MSNHLPSPHGGQGLINRFIPSEEQESWIRKALQCKAYTISNGDLSMFYRIADGTLSPLEGPMDRHEFYRVLDEEVLVRNGRRYAWTIPVAFPVTKQEAEGFAKGEYIAVKNERGTLVGLLECSDAYYFDKPKYNRIVYGTQRTDHPGCRIFNDNQRDYLLGGRIFALPEIGPGGNGQYMLSPCACRELFKARGWERIVAFQTRNPLHRAHEYAMVYAMETLTRQGIFTGVVLNPLLGETKPDDLPAEVRMKTYEVLIAQKLLGQGDKDEALWKEKGVDITDNMMLIGLDVRMFYAGPKEAVMHAIYRQNCGFTDIIIGRKHADAPFDDGTAAWGDFDAQEKFSHLQGELSIRPFKVGTAAYFLELGKVALEDDHKGKGYRQISLSGKELRKKLEKGEPIDDAIMRAPVSGILFEAYRENIGSLRNGIKSKNIVWHYSDIKKEDRERRNGHRGVAIWLTGLSCAGKSTIAVEIQKILFGKGCCVFILDGDNIRHGLNRDLGFSPKDREENIRRIGEVAKLFAEAGFIIITAFVSPYRKDRDDVRALFPQGEFIEVFVSASLSACESRDVKGLYKKARKGEIAEFTGITAPYEEPLKPELVVNTETQDKTESAQAVLRYLAAQGIVQCREG